MRYATPETDPHGFVWRHADLDAARCNLLDRETAKVWRKRVRLAIVWNTQGFVELNGVVSRKQQSFTTINLNSVAPIAQEHVVKKVHKAGVDVHDQATRCLIVRVWFVGRKLHKVSFLHERVRKRHGANENLDPSLGKKKIFLHKLTSAGTPLLWARWRVG